MLKRLNKTNRYCKLFIRWNKRHTDWYTVFLIGKNKWKIELNIQGGSYVSLAAIWIPRIIKKYDETQQISWKKLFVSHLHKLNELVSVATHM